MCEEFENEADISGRLSDDTIVDQALSQLIHTIGGEIIAVSDGEVTTLTQPQVSETQDQ